MRRAILCVALLAACLAARARQDQGKDKDKPKRAEPTGDFVTKALESSFAEIDLGRLAAKQGSTAEVRKLAQQLLDDHKQLSKELSELVSKKKLELPTHSDAEHDRLARRIGAMKGAPFDRSYLESRAGDQMEVVGMFERQARDGKDDDVRAWAKKKLPDLRANLRAVRALRDRIEGPDRPSDKDKKDR